MVFDRMEFAGIVRRRERFPYAAYQSLSPTRRNPFGIPFLGGIVVHPIELGPFSFADTIRLIGNLCPLLHTSVDRRKLFESLATDGEEAELRKRSFPFWTIVFQGRLKKSNERKHSRVRDRNTMTAHLHFRSACNI
jgi:hypothetical protein